MKKLNWHLQPEHGLDIEDTLAAGDRLGVEFLSRYWWARSLLGRTAAAENQTAVEIWDLGCGCGYGSRILAEGPGKRMVTAVDVDPVALNAVYGSYGDRVDIEVIEQALDWEVPAEAGWPNLAGKKSPEMIVAFELLEALRHRDIFLELVKAHLSPNGIFLLNAAHHNRAVTSLNPPMAYVHYSRDGIEKLLKRYFKFVFFGEDRGSLFEFYKPLNEHIRANYPAVLEPFETGNDVIVCSDGELSRG